MKPKVIVHNGISLDGKLRGFEIDLETYYGIVGEYQADMHLVGSNTAKQGISDFMESVPEETEEDFHKPDKEGIYWAIPDTRGLMKGFLHVLRQSEYCKDPIVLISEKTPQDYIDYLKERDYEFHVIGKDHVEYEKALELMNEKHGVKTILTDTGGTLSSVLLKQGLVNEISILISPFLVGKKEIGMFDKLELKKNVTLELKETKKIKSMVLLKYHVVH